MKRSELVRRRMAAHGLSGARRRTAAEVVEWFGCVQAQDLPASLWALGVRTGNATAPSIEQAMTDGHIVRTWPMRGTLHYVCARDVYWMTQLMVPRVLSAAAARHRELNLTERDFAVAEQALRVALAGGRRLPRAGVLGAMVEAGVATDGQRGSHLINNLAMHGVLYLGGRIGRQPGIGLLEDLIGGRPDFDREQALSDIATRYVRSHGPVTVHDLASWTGLTIAESRLALRLAGDAVATTEVDGTPHWLVDAAAPRLPGAAILLHRFDEYVLGYRNRDPVLDPQWFERIVPGRNGMFMPVVIESGRVSGTWRIEQRKVAVDTFEPHEVDVSAAAARYLRFSGQTPA